MNTSEARRAAVALVTIGLHAHDVEDTESLRSLSNIGVASWKVAEWQLVAYALSGMGVGLVRDLARRTDREPEETLQALASHVAHLAEQESAERD